ncbi:hypothetical protein [Marinovum algicola]|uniref:hypothetical protein n=1 Tax=Marinovum algicola TaxID=42444 RepID=UPI003B52DC8B
MAKAKNSFEVMARDAAARLDKARDAGEQLTFLPDEAGSLVDVSEDRAVGRPKGAKGKVSNQMRDWLATKGYRMPEDVLAQMAGLASSGDAVLAAMERAELVLAWAYDGAKRNKTGGGTEPVVPTGAERRETFMQLYTIQLRAADALLPYGAPKATPDVSVNQNVNVVVPVAPTPGHGAETARDVTPQRGRIGGRMVPADVRHEMMQNQEVSESDEGNSDA